MKSLLLLLTITLAASLTAPPQALARDSAVKDSIYFMMDDGEYSEEDMQEEALYVQQKCSENFLQRIYYNCECIAGAFIQQREEQGPMYPQSTIVYSLFREDSDIAKKCSNNIGIAGAVYSECAETSKIFRDKKSDNEQYCTCMANTVAKRFAQRPYLRTKYIRNIKVDAMLDCNDLNSPERLLADQQVEEKKQREAEEAAKAAELEKNIEEEITNLPPALPQTLQ